MIVGFDGTILAGAQTGIGYYTRLLIAHLQAFPEVDMRTYNGLRMNPPNPPSLPASDGVQAAALASSQLRNQLVSQLRQIPGARPSWNLVKATGFKLAARGIDLFHATNYLPPRAVDLPTLSLIHDVSHIRHPQWHPKDRVNWLERRSEEFFQAPFVHTVSHFSAREITQTLGIPTERIHVTYPGINPAYCGPRRDEAAQLAAQDLKAGQFFLCVGTLEPRKNLRLAIEAYGRLPAAIQNRMPLLVVGPRGWGDLNLGRQAETLERRGALRFLGYLPEPAMRALYQECAALLFPSVYEGFGMPVSEAMACGSRPLIAADGAPHEVAGDLGVALSPQDPLAWSEALKASLDENWHGSPDLRQALQDRSKLFDWRQNASATLRLYSALLDQA